MGITEALYEYRDFGADALLGADDAGPPDLAEVLVEIPEEFSPESIPSSGVSDEVTVEAINEDPFTGEESERWVANSIAEHLRADRRRRKVNGEAQPKVHRKEAKSKDEIPKREIEVFDETEGHEVTKVVQIPLSEREQKYANGIGARLSAKEREEADQALKQDSEHYKSGEHRPGADDGWSDRTWFRRLPADSSRERSPKDKRPQILARTLDEEIALVSIVEPTPIDTPYHAGEDSVLEPEEAQQFFGMTSDSDEALLDFRDGVPDGFQLVMERRLDGITERRFGLGQLASQLSEIDMPFDQYKFDLPDDPEAFGVPEEILHLPDDPEAFGVPEEILH